MAAIQKFIKLAFIVTLFLTVVACDEEDPQPDPQVPKTPEQLIAGPWRVVTVVRADQLMNAASFRIGFRTGGTFDFTTSDVPGFPQAGNWVYQASTKVIKLDGVIDLKVIGEITASKFEFEYVYTNHKMGNVVVLFTLGPA